MCEDGLDLGLIALFKLDDGSSCKSGEHGGCQLGEVLRRLCRNIHQARAPTVIAPLFAVLLSVNECWLLDPFLVDLWLNGWMGACMDVI